MAVDPEMSASWTLITPNPVALVRVATTETPDVPRYGHCWCVQVRQETYPAVTTHLISAVFRNCAELCTELRCERVCSAWHPAVPCYEWKSMILGRDLVNGHLGSVFTLAWHFGAWYTETQWQLLVKDQTRPKKRRSVSNRKGKVFVKSVTGHRWWSIKNDSQYERMNGL